MRHDTAGDPMSGIKWTRRTTSNISGQLATLGIAVSKNTVGRLLKQMDFRLRVNRKQIASTKSPDRNQQFLYIAQQKERFAAQGLPIISVDAKKKELIGNFKNTGAKWDRDPLLVKDHDFRSEAKALATPYGIYDMQANRGSVFVGTSHDPQPLPSMPFCSGGFRRAANDIRLPLNCSSWLMAEEAMAHVAAPGKRRFRTPSAFRWV
jgi:hypothetical protein